MRDFCTDYADALFQLASEENSEQEYLAQLETVCGVLGENADFVKFLDSPAVSKEERLAAIDEAFSGAEQNIINFIKILTEKRRAFCLEKCIGLFRNAYDAKNGIERAVCVTAVPLSDVQKQALQEKLEGITGKTIILTNEVNTDVVGGVLLCLNDKEINGSVAMRLSEMEKAIRN